jgi:hypothetical protein
MHDSQTPIQAACPACGRWPVADPTPRPGCPTCAPHRWLAGVEAAQRAEQARRERRELLALAVVLASFAAFAAAWAAHTFGGLW